MTTPISNGSLRALLPLVLLCLLGALAVPLAAQQPKQCQVTVREILADNSGQGLADELKGLKKDLDKLNYNSYRQSNTYQLKVAFSESSNLKLVGDNQLTLTAEGLDESGKIRLKVKLAPHDSKDKTIEMVLRIPDGGTFLLGGPAHGQGVLILAFTAKL